MPSTLPPAAPRRAMLLAGALVSALWLAGCASLQPKTAEEQVRERAEARWAALVKRDFPKAWQYTQPGFRAVVPADRYQTRFGEALVWKSAIVHSVECQAERCTVRVRVTSDNMVPNFRTRLPEITSYVDEAWLRDEGQWWFYQAL